MKTSKYIFALVFTVWCAVGNLYAVTSDDYSLVNGKSGADLFNAVHSVAKTGYTTGLTYKGLWTVYCDIDLNSSSKVWDMYSNATSYTCGGSAQGANYSKEGDSYNREHSIPKSWFGGSEEAGTPGTDLFHVVPTDGYVNNMRSAYAFGEVSSASYTSQSGCKKGTPKSITISNSILNKSGSSTQSCSASTVFEPMDEFKGDFARGYFGTMIKWANGDYQKFTTAEGAQIFNTAYDAAHYYGLTGYGVALLLKWHREDPVSQKEIDRNDGIQSKQGNRNPFIDYPELVEYIWGEHSGETVTLSSLTPTFEDYTPLVTTTYTVILSRNGATEAISGQTGTYTLPAKNTEADACANWAFDGWSSSKVDETTTLPSYITSVSSASTVYAVYAKTESAGSAPHRATMAESTVASVTFSDASSDGTADKSSSISELVNSASGISSYSGSKVYAGTTGVKIGSGSATGSITLTLSSAANVKSVVVNAKKYGSDSGTLSVTAGSTAVGSAQSPNSTAGNLTFTATTAVSNTTTITVATSSKRAYIKSITVIAEGGGSTTTTYYASEPEDCNCSGKLSTPAVIATPSDGTITLTWSDVTNATNGYTVTISKGTGYTTECGDVEVGDITHSGSTNTCVITGLVNGLSYTTSVVANATATTCDSDPDEDTTTPVGCTAWDDPTFTYASYTLTAGGSATAAPTVGAGHGTRTFTSSDESVLTVASDGKVTPKSAGTATVTVHWAGADGYCPKDVTSSTFTVNGKVTVTFDKNDGSSTTTTQQVDYNIATALTANAFTRTGYTFLGWATEASGAKVYNDGASITITAATTLYAVWQVNTHKVAFSPSPTGATVKVNNSTTSPVNNVAYGTTVNIVVTPAAHYTIGSVTANGGVAVSGSGNNWSFTMPDKDVVITVIMVEDTKYTVNWYVSGTPTPEEKYAGEALAGISDPTIDCNDKVFVGWTSHNNYNSDEAPDDLFTSLSGLVMPSNNSTNYYAVFARESAGEPVLTNNYKKITSTSEFSTGNYLIVANHSDTYKAMSTTWKDTYYLSYVTVTPSNDVISTTDGTIIWNIAVSNNQASIYNATSKYLYIEQSGSYYNIKLGDNTTANKFTYGVSSGNWLFTSVTYNTRVLEFYTTRDRWAYHTAADAPVYLYKQQSNSSTTYSDYSTSCTPPTEVTVTFNANGGTGSMSDQVVDYNTATALTANTFTRTGYSFAGWATTADGSKAYDDHESVTLTKNTTLYALWTKKNYNVTFSTPTGASAVTVNGQSTSPQSVEFGATVTVAVTPAITHTIGSVSAGSAVVTDNGDNTYTFTMPASDVTISVTMNAKPVYAIRFFDGDTQIGATQNIVSGQAATKPATDPAGCEDYTFVGWWTATLADDNTTTHTWVTDFTNVTSAQDYYAVYRHVDDGAGGSGEVTFNFTDIASANSWAHDSNHPEVSISPVTINVTKGSANYQGRWWNTDKTWRIYSGNTVTVTCSSGDVTSVSSNPSKAFTISEGEATFSGAANFTSITVNYGGATTYYVTSKVCDCTTPTLTFDQTSLTKYAGDAAFINPLTVVGNDLHAALTFSSSNTNKATVDNDGKVTILQALSSNEPITITATLAKVDKVNEGDPCQAKATASYTLNIYNKVTWSVNGTEYTTGNPTTYTTQGGSINAYPTDPDGTSVCGGKTFMGWTTAELDETDTPPATLYNGLSSMSDIHHTSSTTYYAVFAEATTTGGGNSNTYTLVEEELTDWSGNYIIVNYSGNNKAMKNTASGGEFSSKDVSPSNKQITTTDNTIIWIFEQGTGDNASKYSIKSKDSDKYAAIGSNSTSGSLNDAASYLTITHYGTSHQNDVAGSSGRFFSYYSTNTTFRTYSGSSDGVYLYRNGSSTSYSAYSTYCGPVIRAKEVERLTSTKDQTVKSQAIVVKGSSLTGSTLTASITGAGASHFTCTPASTAISAGAINTTYTISYTPTVYGATHVATLTFSDGTTESDPITLRGRSLPEQFAIVAYDGANYYVLDGTMSGEASTVRPLPVTVTNGEVVTCPSRAVYSLTQLATPDQNVYLVSNDKRLYGAGSSTGLNMKSMTSTSGTNWLLSTSDFSTYHIINATSTDRGVMYNGANNVFGHYATSNYGHANYYGDLCLLPIAATCTCLDAPRPTVVARSTTATITWGDVTGATRYEVTCSGGSVSVSGTTATITGLTTNTNYTYTLKAVASGTDCSQVYNGGFRTTVCDDVPQDIKVTPNVTSAIVRWTADADKATVRVYSDAECTSEVVSKADMVSGDEITGLTENRNYYLKVFAGPDQTCASAAVAFNTISTAVEIVEWMTDGVKIILTGDELTATVLVEDKQENKGGTTTNYADSIFISKYFEADDQNKLVAIYNGTRDTIDLSHYCLKRSQLNAASLTLDLSSYGRIKPGYIAPNEEIILIRYATSSANSAEECASEQEGYENWYILDNETNPSGANFLNFSGPMSVGLYSKTANKFIDVVGATTNATGTGELCQINASNKVSCTYAEQDFNDAAGFYTLEGDNYQTEEVETDYGLSTNRCLLIRKNTVKSGLNAVENNVYSTTPECNEEIAQAFTTLSSEWAGLQIGSGSSSGETHSKTCIGMGNVGGFDYQGYYAQFDSVTVVENLINNKNPDGTITIPVDGLDTMSCSMMRIKVYEGGVEKATTEKRVPIMVHSGEIKTTNELFTKHEAAACAECDVVVFSGATLQKGEEASGRNAIHDLTLYPGSTLDLPSGKGDYSVNSIIYRVDGDNVPTTKLEGNLLTESQKLVVTRRITNDRYYFLSMPYDCDLADITLSNGIPAVNGVDYRLLEYDAEARAEEGSRSGVPGHWKLATGTMKAGQGYAIAVSSTKPKEIVFPMTIPSKNLTNEERTKVTNTVDINEYTGAARNTNHNWNLIAHPYITKFEVTSGATPGTTNVEAYWEHPSRRDSAWVDDWETWEDPTQPTDSTETHTGEIVESGTTEGGIVWVLYADGSIELTGAGQMSDFTSLDAVPWARHRQLIQNVKIGGDVQKIGKYAFGQCTNLTNVIIAAPVTNLASQAFAGCTGLRTFRIESAQYVSATTTTFDGISSLTMISLYVPQSMYSQYSAQTPWSKMAISAFDDNSTTGGQTSGDGTNTTNPSPRRAPVHDGWTESPGGIYVTIPVVKDGKVGYDQYWINEVTDIKPFTAVFIQGDGQGEMTFNMYPSSPAPKRMLQAAPCETRDHTVFVGLTINGNGQKDKTSLRLRPDFTEEYKFNLDLLKFTVFNTARPQIYFKTPDDQLAFRAISDSLAEHSWIPVGVYCRDAGTYTFSLYDKYVLDEIEAVYLHDNVTGITTNLLYGNYTIETTKQLYTNTRFTLNVILRRKVEVDTPTIIDHTEDPNAPRKFFRDGVMYIMRDGKIYDLTGKPAELDKLMLNR